MDAAFSDAPPEYEVPDEDLMGPAPEGAKANGHDAGAEVGEAKKPRIMSGRDFLATFQPPDYVIDGVVQKGRLYACTSITGHGKTAVWLLLSCMVVNNRSVGSLGVTQGDVVILAGENPDDLCGRLHAACLAYGLGPNRLPYVLPRNFPLDAKEAEKLKDEIDALACSPVLIVVDTAAAFFPGEDENQNVAAGAYARDALRVLTKCRGNPAVVVLSHPVKNADHDNLLPRGGGAFLNELDGNLTLWSDALGEETTLHWHGKIRGSDFAPIHFTLRQIEVHGLSDSKGRPFVSIVAEVQSPEAAANAQAQTVSDENTVLYWLNQSPGMSVRDIARNAGWVSKTDQPLKNKVQKLLQSLKKEKLVRLYRKKWTLTDAGKKEITRS